MLKQNILVKIARLYYLEGYNQRAIANRLNISMASVSRAIKRAKEERIVEIRVHDSDETDAQLETALEQQYSLRESWVVRTDDAGGQVSSAMSEALSDMLTRLIKPQEVIGVSWGETLRSVADNLRNTGGVVANAIPIIGAMGTVETGIYPNAIAKSFADKLGGRAYLVNTPAVFSSRENRVSMQNDQTYIPVSSIWSEIHTAVVSVSGISEKDSVYRYEIFGSDVLAYLRTKGAVCATNFDFLDEDGNLIHTDIDERMIKLGFTRLREMPNLIVVAFGERKIEPIRAVLRSGVVNILITDKPTATAVVQSENADEEDSTAFGF